MRLAVRQEDELLEWRAREAKGARENREIGPETGSQAIVKRRIPETR